MPVDQEIPFVHPYIANSAPKVRAEMLKAIGVNSIVDLYAEIPEALRFKERLDIPEAMLSEIDVRRHMLGLLNKNTSCAEYINFLGAGTWQHAVPAVCDEVNGRAEFYTAYVGHQYSDLGKYQAQFEAQSMIAELVNKDFVGASTYDGISASATIITICTRITERNEVLVPAVLNPDMKLQFKNWMKKSAKVTYYNYDPKTGKIDLNDLKSKLTDKVGCVYFENPNFFGVIEDQAEEICKLAKAAGAMVAVSVDPISLGVLTAPGDFGADLVCGEMQSIGMHMQYGGGVAGFIATDQDQRVTSEVPTLTYGMVPTKAEGEEYGFGWAMFDRTSYIKRELCADFTGTTAALWMLTAGVYLALLGPQGMKEMGEAILYRSQYAAKKLAGVKGLKVTFSGASFKEFVVDFNGTGKTVADINKALLAKGIFGGVDLSKNFPELGQSALFAVTEVITKENIDKLVDALGEVVK